MTDVDPMEAIRARYERHERLPVERLAAAARSAGCTTSPSRARGVNHEVNYGGMCVGTISVEDGVPVLEMSRREALAKVREMVAAAIAQQRRMNVAGIAAGVSR